MIRIVPGLRQTSSLRQLVALRHARGLCTGVSPMKTGTEFYMSLYPEGSTDG